ncbi:uncharacterized protein TrAtP1_010182 [Trichoderma atroviride]|uniref:F-box domain-containing protein n=1 Tax=Hypocrea atroviridis (strain ATCC 20476 / IMI 206040) TaxID=452589 RepID=G9NQ11_HYPAI|nr:uncharacterized protein TRIATDRAFT_317103 [Trichoderma atroviride IMI 206040]EHK47163.1 hypothetical protein TRIATDRAFT_317103 [Trichoderma atroviride IMI 206040]UKZ69173.1 hypothetical protein TrAtP1_010182 [Trichoderma atroviride]
MACGRSRGRCRGQKRKRSPVQQPSKVGWSDLPTELREMILGALEDLLHGGKAASYALVFKEWNRILEPYIFKRLKLSLDRMEKFRDIVTDRRRLFVQFIWFRFKRCPCSSMSTIDVDSRNDHIKFAYTIYCLFQWLSEWELRQVGQPGIVLELSAFSGFDTPDSMKDTVPKQLQNVDVTEDSDTLNAMYEKLPVRQVRGLPREEVIHRRMLRSFYVPGKAPGVLEAPFPTVKLITDLTVRRQMHSSFFGRHMGRLVKALPRLEFITFQPSSDGFLQEGWHGWSEDENAQPIQDILNAMPSSIRRLQVLEDDVSLYNRNNILPRRGPDRHDLGRLAADISQDKEPEALAMSFIIDALDFFTDFVTPQITRPPDKSSDGPNLLRSC